jgi:hypothetical protein
MRFLTIVVAFAAVGLIGCGGGDPKVYRVSVDASPLNALPNTCYTKNELPNPRDTETNLRTEVPVAIWSGADKVVYLDLNNLGSAPLGDATPVPVAGIIEGTDKSFSSTRVQDVSPTQANNNLQSKDTQTIAVTFDKMDATATGSFTLTSTFSCNQTENCQRVPTCTVTLPFTARQVAARNSFGYAGQ